MDEYDALLDLIMTSTECTERYGIDTATVRMAIRRGRIPARKAGRGRHAIWLLLRQDADRLWGYRREDDHA